MTPSIRSEWERHQTVFARSYLASMEARNKVVDINEVYCEELRDALDEITSTEAANMRKDVHLIEAALQTDRVVASLDDSARGCFGRYSRALPAVSDIAWMNPSTEDDYGVAWLRQGAKRVASRLLGGYSPR